MPHTILIADDSKTIQRAVEIVFAKEADFTVVTAGTGQEALAKVKELRPAVVIADHTMPSGDGYQVAEALKGDPSLSSIPVLLLTSTAAPIDEGRANNVGAQHIVKPFDCMSLLDRVQRMCGLKAADAPAPSPFAHLRPAGSGPAPAIAGQPTSTPTPTPAPAQPPAAAAPPPAALPRPPGGQVSATSPQWGQGPAASAPMAAAPVRPDPFGLADNGASRPAAAAPAHAPAHAPAQPAQASRTPDLGFGAAPPARDLASSVVAQAQSQVTTSASAQIAASGAGAPSAEAVSAAAREIIEKVVWEVVPELAETLIREEIARLLKERR